MKPSPFRQLDLQLQLEELEQKWEEIRKEYDKDKANVETVDEILKIAVEKIKVLAEISMNTFKA